MKASFLSGRVLVVPVEEEEGWLASSSQVCMWVPVEVSTSCWDNLDLLSSGEVDMGRSDNVAELLRHSLHQNRRILTGRRGAD